MKNIRYKNIKIIEDNWKIFPFKLDYLFYILYYEEKPSDITFRINDINEIIDIAIRNLEKKTLYLDNLTINKEDILNFSEINDNHFVYETKIFNSNLNFRCQKIQLVTDKLLVFRFLDIGLNIDVVLNEKIEKFIQYCELTKKLNNTKTHEKNLKI